jgi:hypothetical protein
MRTTTSTSAGHKGQSAFEFMFIFGVMLGAVLLTLWVSTTKSTEIQIEQRNMEIRDVISTVAEKVNTAWIEGKGYSTNVTIPGKIAGTDYDINITSRYIMITLAGERYLGTMITGNVTGSFESGATSTLRNTGDTIEIS